MNLIWTEPAEASLEEILAYIAADNPDAAWEVADRIHSAVDSLMRFPNQGRIGRVKNTRELVVRPS